MYEFRFGMNYIYFFAIAILIFNSIDSSYGFAGKYAIYFTIIKFEYNYLFILLNVFHFLNLIRMLK